MFFTNKINSRERRQRKIGKNVENLPKLKDKLVLELY